jgi:hypothetical protein
MLIEIASSSPTFGEAALAVVTNDPSKATFSRDLEARLLATLRTTDELRAIYETSPINHRAWAALAIKSGREMLEDSRQMLDSDAADFRRRLGTVAEEYVSTMDFVAESLRAAACALIGDVGEGLEDEVRLAKEVGMGDLVSPRPALIALSKIANPSHFSAIREALPSIDDYTFVQDAEQLLSSALAPLLADIWKSADVPALKEASQRWLAVQSDSSDEQLEEALYDETARVRIAALEVVVARRSKEQLRELLGNYPSGGKRHWYNVVAGIDEVLYGPISVTQPPAVQTES